MRKLRSQRAIVAEYNRVNGAREKTRAGAGYEWAWLQGAQQALAWALNDNATAPAKLYAPQPRKRKPKS